MKTIELWFGKWDSPSIFFNILSIEFEIVPKITSLNELERLVNLYRKCFNYLTNYTSN